MTQQTSDTGRRESQLEMCLRLRELNTKVALDPSSVTACHRLGEEARTRTSCILSVSDRKNGSKWDILANGMMTGKTGKGQDTINFSLDNVFINFQLTKKRMNLIHQCRLLQKQKPARPIAKHSVNQNGRITVLKTPGSGRWEEVKEMEHLAEMAGVAVPVPRQGQEAPEGKGQEQRR